MMSRLTDELLAWYAAHGRDLPWRRSRDPYAIWVSEVMLQQTQVETVLPYYQRWMARFPTLKALAQASIDDVLNQWEGLGYYRRAHSLHQASRQLLADGRDSLPQTVPELEALPGIGRYTARAVAAIAFGADVLALDGNLRRVLARLFDVDQDVATAEGERRLRELGESLLPPGRTSAFNQALMDLGADVCLSRGPTCSACPLASMCRAYQAGTQEERPVRPTRKPRPHRERVQIVLQREGRVLVGRRPPSGLLGGLWAFPETALAAGEAPDEAARRMVEEDMGLRPVVVRSLGDVEHAYTHFGLTVHAFACQVGDGTVRLGDLDDLRWIQISELDGLAMGKVDRSIAKRLSEQ
jgi:A/G-specific adenine glycosylase